MQSRLLSFSLRICCAALGPAACGDAADKPEGQGEVVVTVYGEDFIEEGIPATAMDDGWAVSFDEFSVDIENVVVGGAAMPESEPVDISEPSAGNGHEIARATVSAGSYTDSSYTISWIEIVGSATKDGSTKTFNWAFEQPVHYEKCETTTEVVAGKSATFQITVHADHLFFDSLVSQEPSLLFQPLADADTDDDGSITRAELEAADIGSYDPGSAGEVNNLWAWITALSHTLGHVDGEGHCHAVPHDQTPQ